MNTPTTQQYHEAAQAVLSWRRPLLISHARPDGDALGSLVAMRSLLKSHGVEATAALFDPIPSRYALFERFAPLSLFRPSRDRSFQTLTSPRKKDSNGQTLPLLHETQLDQYDGIIVLDTCAYSQLEPIRDWLRSSHAPKLAVDHHGTRDELADHYLIDESAAATCLILYEWAKAVQWQPEPDAREAMFIGIATDTGWFQYSNTDARAFSAAAELAAGGVCTADLCEELFRREKAARVKLLGEALQTLEMFAENRGAVMSLPREAFERAGAEHCDTEDIVNEPLRIETVFVSVLLTESDDGVVRASFRSKPPRKIGTVTVPDVNVAASAQVFGGGGHPRAAGARMHTTLSEARSHIVAHFENLFAAFGKNAQREE